MRRIRVCLQGTLSGAYPAICTGKCNAVDRLEDKQGWGFIFFRGPKSAIADWNVVPTGSMKPTIVEGDRIFVNKLAYDLKIPYTTRHIAQWRDPKRGDIVVFYSPIDNTRLVKRVVGLPGDKIAMHQNALNINGTRVDYEAFDINHYYLPRWERFFTSMI